MKRLFFFGFAAAVCATASAQLTPGIADLSISGTGVGGFIEPSIGATQGANSYTGTFLSDAVYSFARSNSDFSLRLDTFVPMTVGPYPISLDTIKISFDTSWIITGDGTTTVRPEFFAGFYEQLGAAPDPTTDPVGLSVSENTAAIQGNGRYSVKDSFGFGYSRFLTPGNYYFDYGYAFSGSVTDFTSGDLTPGLTVEAGGDHTSGEYGGVVGQFGYTAAPEPGTYAMCGLGLLFLVRKRRK